jgi:predicted nuclease of predicted toxin-antitoxin system
MLIRALRETGHDVLSVLEHSPAASDTAVLALAAQDNRILLTEDNDFGGLIFANAAKAGVTSVVLLRIANERQALKVERLLHSVSVQGEHLLGRYTVIDETRIRSRRLPTR